MSKTEDGVLSNYVAQILITNEVVLCKAKIHWIVFMPAILITIVLLPVALVYLNLEDPKFLGIVTIALFWIYAWLKKRSTELVITNKRIIAKFGIISRSTFEIDLRKVEGINFKQGITARILKYASILVKGIGGNYAPIPNIANFIEFKKVYQEQAFPRE